MVITVDCSVMYMYLILSRHLCACCKALVNNNTYTMKHCSPKACKSILNIKCCISHSSPAVQDAIRLNIRLISLINQILFPRCDVYQLEYDLQAICVIPRKIDVIHKTVYSINSLICALFHMLVPVIAGKDLVSLIMSFTILQ